MSLYPRKKDFYMNNPFLLFSLAILTSPLFTEKSHSKNYLPREPKQVVVHLSDDTSIMVPSGLKQLGMEGIRSRFLDKKCEFFYFSESPETAMEIIKEMAALDEFGPRIVFLIALLEMYPEQLLQGMQEAGIKLESSVPLIHALNISGLKNEAFTAGMKAGLSSDILMNFMEPNEGWPLESKGNTYVDAMVGGFWATGITDYINNLLDILDLTPEDVSPSFNLEGLKERAKECLLKLVPRHEKAYHYFLKEDLSRSGESKRFVDETNEKYQGFINSRCLPEGMLGDIWISDNETLTEVQAFLPLESRPTGKVICAIPNSLKTQQIKILPLFSSFTLDKDFNGYVTYDIDVYDPEGNKVCSFNEKKGLKGKISSRYLVHAAEDAIEINFQFVKKQENTLKSNNCYIEAKPGTYKIQGVIKDRIGNNELKIIRTIDVLP